MRLPARLLPRFAVVVAVALLLPFGAPPGLEARKTKRHQRQPGNTLRGHRPPSHPPDPSQADTPFPGCLPRPPPLTPSRHPGRHRACARKDPLGDFSLILLHPHAPERWKRAIRAVGAQTREVVAWLPPPDSPAESDLIVQAEVAEDWGQVLRGSGHLRIQQVGGDLLTAMQTILRAAATASGEVLLFGLGGEASWLEPEAVSEALRQLRLNPTLGLAPIAPVSCHKARGSDIASALASLPEILQATGWEAGKAECPSRAVPGVSGSLCQPGGVGRLCTSGDSGAATQSECADGHGRAHWGLLVQYFQQPANLEPLAKGLADVVRGSGSEAEVVVMDDSSSEIRSWAIHLGRAARQEGRIRVALLVSSNNLHEIRAYNYASRLAQTHLLAMLQDDDDPSGDPRWLRSAASLMASHPGMALLGGHRGRLDCSQGGGEAPMDQKRHQAEGLKFGPGHLNLPTRDPRTGQPFMFAYKVNAAPLVVLRDVLLRLGGLHAGLSCPGEAGIVFDFELSVRMWAEGYQVGLFNSGFRRLAHASLAEGDGSHHGAEPGNAALVSGTRRNRSAHKVRIANYHRNNQALYRMYPDFHHHQGTKLALQLTRGLLPAESTAGAVAGDSVLGSMLSAAAALLLN